MLLLSVPVQADPVVFTAIASNFVHVIPRLRLDDDESVNVRLSFGSSGNFSRQIIQGAPFDIFISASREYIKQLEQHHIAIAELAVFAEGQLSIYLPQNSRLYDKTRLAEVMYALQTGEFSRLAIPNPEYAPYGIAARQALSQAGVWAIKTRQLVLGENAAQAMQFCTTNNVDTCIVPTSFMYAIAGNQQGKHFPIPHNWHKPIRQYIALLDDTRTSRQLFQTLVSEKTKAVLARFGYLPTD